MTEPTRSKDQTGRQEESWDFEGTRRHHIRSGLKLTPVERLRWLEETVDEMRKLQGLARKARKAGEAQC